MDLFSTFYCGKPVPPQVDNSPESSRNPRDNGHPPPPTHRSRPAILGINGRAAKDGATGETEADLISITSDERSMFLTLRSVRQTAGGSLVMALPMKFFSWSRPSNGAGAASLAAPAMPATRRSAVAWRRRGRCRCAAAVRPPVRRGAPRPAACFARPCPAAGCAPPPGHHAPARRGPAGGS